MFIQIFPACVIIHTLAGIPPSSYPLFAFSATSFFPSLPFFLCFDLWERTIPAFPPTPSPPPPPPPPSRVRHHALFLPSSLEISIYFCLVYYLHIAHNLCLLISGAILRLHSPARLLSNFPALGPIHLPLSVPASLDHNIAHSPRIPHATSILSSPHTTPSTPHTPPVPSLHLLHRQTTSKCRKQPALNWGGRLGFCSSAQTTRAPPRPSPTPPQPPLQHTAGTWVE